MSKVKFFLGQPKQVEFEAKRPMIFEESKVQSDYAENDPSAPSFILNRPFYSETVTEPLEITWDGAWGGRPYIVLQIGDLGGIALVKISDEFFDFEKTEVVSVTATVSEEEQSVPISELYVRTVDDEVSQILYEGYPLVFSVAKDMSAGDIELSKGTYFARIVELDDEVGLVTAFVSALSLSAVTYEKYHKLSNEYVDAEWMATESAGEGEKRFDLETVADLFILGERKGGVNLYRLDSRAYTKDELLSARLTLRLQGFEVTYAVVGAEEGNDFVSALLVGFTDSFVLLSVFQDADIDGAIFEKGLYFAVADNDIDLNELEQAQATLEIFRAAGQLVPNKLPNKFLDVDWVPKAETYTELLYSGELSPEGAEDDTIQYDSQLRDLDTVLLFEIDGVTREARCVGTNFPGYSEVAYIVVLDNGDLLSVIVGSTIAYLEYILTEPVSVSIKIVKKRPNPLPSYFLPSGLGSSVVVKINNSLSDGLDGYEIEINTAWNSGARVVLSFTDATLTLLSFELNLDGVAAVGVTPWGHIYLFNPLDRGDDWALSLSARSDDGASVLFKANGDTEFKPTELNSTLTEGSTLPAQEGAVFTAIQELRDTIGTLNQDLENRLNGGT